LDKDVVEKVKEIYFFQLLYLPCQRVIFCVDMCRTKLRWSLTRASGTCGGSSCTRAFRSVCGPSLALQHNGPSARNHLGTSKLLSTLLRKRHAATQSDHYIMFQSRKIMAHFLQHSKKQLVFQWIVTDSVNIA